MVQILKHGKGDYYKLYKCDRCECVYKSTEYTHNIEYGYIARCPECNKPNIDLVGSKASEVMSDLYVRDDELKNIY